MKKVTVALALMMSVGLTGCANTDVFSGDVYSADQAKEARSISYGTIVSVRPVKIQADNNGVIGSVGGGALGGIAGSAIGGGTGQAIAGVIGAIGGAIAGSKIEEKMSQVNGAELVIRKDNREEIVVVQKADPSFKAGRRVRIVGGSSLNVSVIKLCTINLAHFLFSFATNNRPTNCTYCSCNCLSSATANCTTSDTT